MKGHALREQYTLCWKFLQEIKWYVVFAVGIFALTFLVGFTFPIFFKNEIMKFIIEMTNLTKGKSMLQLIMLIFLNNVKASIMIIVFGIIFGIFPLIAAVVNGYLLGFVSRGVASSNGISILWKLLPHGIFELPAILFSIGIGIKIGIDIFGNNPKKKLQHNMKEAMRFFLFIILPLLLIAGIIEGTLIFLLR